MDSAMSFCPLLKKKLFGERNGFFSSSALEEIDERNKDKNKRWVG